MDAALAFVPRVPREQCDGKGGGERHVGRSGVGKNNDGGATGRDQGPIEFTARAEAAKKKVNCRDKESRVEGAGQARSLVGNAASTERHIACQ